MHQADKAKLHGTQRNKNNILMPHLEPEAKIFACSQSVYLAEKIDASNSVPLGKVTFTQYI